MTVLQAYHAPNLPRLLAKLDTAASSASGDLTPILVCAPAGYGKTKLVSEWLTSRDVPAVARLRCLPESSGRFLEDLARAVTHALGLPDLPSDDPAALPRLCAELQQPLTLVIDDYHFATTPENDLALLDLTGPKLRLIVIARRVYILDGPLAVRRVPMLTLGRNELALTHDEAFTHACTRFNAQDSSATRAALELAQGWPLALRAIFAPAASAAPSTPGSDAATALDPLAALTRFAHQQCESLTPLPQRLLAGAVTIDAIDTDQAIELSGQTETEVRSAINQLLELGLIIPAPSGDTEEFSCHPGLKPSLIERAARLLGPQQQTRLRVSRAAKLAPTTPVSAFLMYLSAEAYAEAEMLLEQHFTTITDEVHLAAKALRSLSKDTLMQHPSFISARLLLELPNPQTPESALDYLTALWSRSLKLHLETPDQLGELGLPYLAQAMAASRMNGDIDTALRISHELEARVDSLHVFSSATRQPGYGARSTLGSGALPVFYRELATTALMAGQVDRARRIFERLRTHAERLIAHPWHGFSPASVRSVSDVESGRRWLLAALSELALTEIVDGDMTRARALIAEADDLAAVIESDCPGLSALSREVARAQLSYEIGAPDLLTTAAAAIAPFKGRAEHLPLLLHAEVHATATARGPEWALPVLEAGITQRTGRRTNPWARLLAPHSAMLTTVLGRFTDSDRLLDAAPPQLNSVRIERARRALFSGDNVQALLLALAVGDANTTVRQQTHRCLVIACAAWGCGETRDAIGSLQSAMARIERYGLRSPLHAVPYTTLLEVAEAARAAGVVDATDLIAAIPEPARAKRYEMLTDMELRTLSMIARQGSTTAAAEALFVSPSTVKKHLNSVYRKLDVRGRDEALLQAGQMGLIPAG